MKRTLYFALATIGLLALAPGAHADLVTNGSFANLDNTTGYPIGWSVTGDGISVDQAFAYGSDANDMSFATGSADPSVGVLSQTLTTSPGQEYTLQFELEDESNFSTEIFSADFGGLLFSIQGDDPSLTLGNYSLIVLDVPGSDITSASTTLSFSGINDAAAWNLDDVSVTPVGPVSLPEPAGVLLLLGGLVMTVATRRVWRQVNG
jgi:hypothetical protein